MASIKETDLYSPVRDYLSGQGYCVRSEVKDCDITATRKDELVVVELKTNFNATLLIQAADRQRIADAVYIALPHPDNTDKKRNFKGMCHLLKRLGIGLILVRFLKSGPRIEISFHPGPYTPAPRRKKRQTIIREIRDRSGEYNVGGTTGKKIVTAYRETAIFIACCLRKFGVLSPAKLRELGTGDRTQGILSRNFYGWFERESKGIYCLHPQGEEALDDYPDIVKYYLAIIQEKKDS